MDRRQFLRTVGGAAATAAAVPSFSTPIRAAESEGVPDTSAYLTNDQLTRRLELLDRESDLVSRRRSGRSAGRGDPIWEVTVGEGATSVHLVTQIHGDEPAGTEAALIVLRQLTADPDEFADVLDNVTLTVVPRANPDGAMFARDADGDRDPERLTRRENTQPWRPGDSRHRPDYYDDPAGAPGGYDLNRDFNVRTEFDATPGAADDPDWWSQTEDDGETVWQLDVPHGGHTLPASGLRLTPETEAITRSFLRADPDFAITHHHQATAADPTAGRDRPSIMSVMAPFGPAYAERAVEYDPEAPVAEYVNPFLNRATSDRSLRFSALVARRLSAVGPWDVFDTVTRYGYVSLWGSYLDTLCPKTDAAGMLYEVAGQSDEVGSQAYGLKVEASRIGFLESLRAIAADPKVRGIDESAYFDIPLRGEEIGAGTGGMERGTGGARDRP
ncbi:M14 family zinc carboxypeptidase [Halegenticoccus soli]|uniref:M14 family zinc carboxypeptidase n=1 Tax=Halegenticoccus soli TaxID=1985678 RepID=UPI000C6D0D73|nr:M14 family zinc carboxypeptidase [Halegenticoccus soli]